MTNRERIGLIDLCINAALAGNRKLLECPVSLAVNLAKKGKDDTLIADYGPEQIVVRTLKSGLMNSFLVITEERGKILVRKGSGELPFVVIFIDPVDGSKQLKTHGIRAHRNRPRELFSEIIANPYDIKDWELQNGAPASVTGSCLALTCFADGRLVGTVIVNYVTQELFLACSEGIKCVSIPQQHNLCYQAVMSDGRGIAFLPLAARAHGDYDLLTMATYEGKGKPGYEMNLADGLILRGVKRCLLMQKSANGPGRLLYLSSIHHDPIVGFAFGNGEKITEWIHWLSFVVFSEDEGRPSLQLFQVMPTDIIPVMNGSPMRHNKDESLFQEGYRRRHGVDLNRLLWRKEPHHFRETLMVAPPDNEAVKNMLGEHLRPIELVA